jgi:hypothetical protein
LHQLIEANRRLARIEALQQRQVEALERIPSQLEASPAPAPDRR